MPENENNRQSGKKCGNVGVDFATLNKALKAVERLHLEITTEQNAISKIQSETERYLEQNLSKIRESRKTVHNKQHELFAATKSVGDLLQQLLAN